MLSRLNVMKLQCGSVAAATCKPQKAIIQPGRILCQSKAHSRLCVHRKDTAIRPRRSESSTPCHRSTVCRAAAVDIAPGSDGGAGKPDTTASDEAPSVLGRILGFIGEVLWRTWQLGILAAYAGFWLCLINILWFATGYSNIVWIVPVLWLFISDWALLKMLTVVWVADTLSAWPIVVMKLLFDFIHHIHSARLESFPRSMRVLAAMLGRDLRAPVMANLRILHYTPREAGVLGPLTEPLADTSDTTVFKWNSLFDVAWGVVILWFLYCHFMMYEQWWGSWFPFGRGFNISEILGTWHMPQLPVNWRPDVSGAPVQFISKSVLPWGPYM